MVVSAVIIIAGNCILCIGVAIAIAIVVIVIAIALLGTRIEMFLNPIIRFRQIKVLGYFGQTIK